MNIRTTANERPVEKSTGRFKYVLLIQIFALPSDGVLNTHEPRHDKTNKVTVRPAKTQISLGIRPV